MEYCVATNEGVTKIDWVVLHQADTLITTPACKVGY